METQYIFPGSYCPPTYGHFGVIKKVAKMVPSLTIICSTSQKKEAARWFSEEECLEMWKGYKLPANVTVTTFEKFKNSAFAKESIVMVRGMRTEADFKEEKEVMLDNLKNFGIDKFFYFWSDCDLSAISSTFARQKAEELDLDELSKVVAPLVVTKLLEKVLGLKNLFLVVGKPGSGKSTFLNFATENSSDLFHINTDSFNQQLKPLLHKTFPGRDLVEVAKNDLEELKKAIGQEWLVLLQNSLHQLAHSGKKHVFVEVPYALAPEYKLYNLIGGKVIYFGCEETDNQQRVLNRGTPEHLDFIQIIPGKEASAEIALNEKLQISLIDTCCPLLEMQSRALEFANSLEKGELNEPQKKMV